MSKFDKNQKGENVINPNKSGEQAKLANAMLPRTESEVNTKQEPQESDGARRAREASLFVRNEKGYSHSDPKMSPLDNHKIQVAISSLENLLRDLKEAQKVFQNIQ
jgi:formate dehydrogenase assembly factor FdhD